MRRHFTGDVWTDAKLLQSEERLAAARDARARRARHPDPRSPHPGQRVWLGSFLLAVGHRLREATDWAVGISRRLAVGVSVTGDLPAPGANRPHPRRRPLTHSDVLK